MGVSGRKGELGPVAGVVGPGVAVVPAEPVAVDTLLQAQHHTPLTASCFNHMYRPVYQRGSHSSFSLKAP